MPDFTADSNIIYDGIDVSNYQGDIDFAQVRSSGIEAVYIKAGDVDMDYFTDSILVPALRTDS